MNRGVITPLRGGYNPPKGRLGGWEQEQAAAEADKVGSDVMESDRVRGLDLATRDAFFLSPLYKSFLGVRWAKSFAAMMAQKVALGDRSRADLEVLLEGAVDVDQRTHR